MAKIYTRMNLEERKIMQNLLEEGHNFSQIPGFLKVEQLLNEPQTLGFKKPYQVFAEKIAFFALES